ncbi:MAG: hypothetical protein ABJ275_11360 [Maricaulaceae bacterium]
MTKHNSLTKTVAVAALIIGLTSGIASAKGDKINRLDVNGDEQITQSEFLTGAEARFKKIDVNNDNFISDDERKAHRETRKSAKLDQRFERTDLNNDGVISKDELEQARKKHETKKSEHKAKKKEKFDLNGDGTIDEAEKAEARAAREAKKTENRGDREGRKRGFGAKADANDDGFVSYEEHMAASTRMFEYLDANDDGVLTKGEGKTRRKKHRNKRG